MSSLGHNKLKYIDNADQSQILVSIGMLKFGNDSVESVISRKIDGILGYISLVQFNPSALGRYDSNFNSDILYIAWG